METNNTAEGALIALLSEPFAVHTATSLAEALNITRQGVWKALNKLADDKLIIIRPVGKAKTSTTTIKINWNNILAEKTLALLLTKEALKHQRWRANFAELENKIEFLILFGSVLISPKEANDIDIIAVINKKNFKAVDKTILKLQQTQLKKIHLIDVTADEFIGEIKKANKAYLDAVKKGAVLFGQEKFIQIIKELQNG